MRSNKRIKRRGYYCTKEKKNCEDAYILIDSFKGCEGGIRCDCPKCQHAAEISEDGARAIKETPDGFEVIHKEKEGKADGGQ